MRLIYGKYGGYIHQYIFYIANDKNEVWTMRLSKINHKKLSDQEKAGLLSGNTIQSRNYGKIALLTKEESEKCPDPNPEPGCYRVWILWKVLI